MSNEQKFWWVNQNKTFEHEFKGGYLWSPKKRKGGTRNPFYEFMRDVRPGDVIFSFARTCIKAIGIATSNAYGFPKPLEFGKDGESWSSQVGWKVNVQYQKLDAPVKPREHMASLASLLPQKYAPIQLNGVGLQGVYLTELPFALANKLLELSGKKLSLFKEIHAGFGEVETKVLDDLRKWEDHLEEEIKSKDIPETEKKNLVTSRRGQGLFRRRVSEIEQKCRITGVNNPEHLIAGHIKPWRDSKNDERLDGQNGLLLTPTMDHLFDKGFISFENNGKLIVSSRSDEISLKKMGLPLEAGLNVGEFNRSQSKYLEFHRDIILLKHA